MNSYGLKMYIGAGMWAAQTPDNKFELQDADGEAIGGGKWDSVFKAAEGVALAASRDPEQRRARAYYIRCTGQVFQESDWRHAGCFSEGLAVGGDWMEEKGDFSDHEKTYRLYYFDMDGKRHVLDSKWREARGFHEGLAAVAMERNPRRLSWGFINKNWDVAIPPKWDRVSDFSGGVSVAERGRRFFIIDKKGRKLASDLEEYPDDALLCELRERVKANEE